MANERLVLDSLSLRLTDSSMRLPDLERIMAHKGVNVSFKKSIIGRQQLAIRMTFYSVDHVLVRWQKVKTYCSRSTECNCRSLWNGRNLLMQCEFLLSLQIMIMTDQDQDGSHIKGLIINFIHSKWPALLKQNFVEQFITPIIKVSWIPHLSVM